jgi:hypothetical protein
VTYNRHPLYTFKLDTKAGQTNGEGLNDFGGVWALPSPAGKKVENRLELVWRQQQLSHVLIDRYLSPRRWVGDFDTIPTR